MNIITKKTNFWSIFVSLNMQAKYCIKKKMYPTSPHSRPPCYRPFINIKGFPHNSLITENIFLPKIFKVIKSYIVPCRNQELYSALFLIFNIDVYLCLTADHPRNTSGLSITRTMRDMGGKTNTQMARMLLIWQSLSNKIDWILNPSQSVVCFSFNSIPQQVFCMAYY